MVNIKTVIKLDALGALLSAIGSLTILFYLNHIFGIQVAWLYIVLVWSLIMLAYDLVILKFPSTSLRRFLKYIVCLNCSYCLLLAIALISTFHSLPIIGVVYYFVDMTLICLVIAWELGVLYRLDNKTA
jgi:hypothetical protein